MAELCYEQTWPPRPEEGRDNGGELLQTGGVGSLLLQLQQWLQMSSLLNSDLQTVNETKLLIQMINFSPKYLLPRTIINPEVQ